MRAGLDVSRLLQQKTSWVPNACAPRLIMTVDFIHLLVDDSNNPYKLVPETEFWDLLEGNGQLCIISFFCLCNTYQVRFGTM